MILYFADRKMNILGQASTRLPAGLVIVDDIKTEDIESGVASFEFKIRCEKDNFDAVRDCLAVGNYVLRSRDDENEFYTIIETETDTREQEIYVYAEDAGLDLLNEIVGAYEADKAYNIEYYINKFTFDSGFVIGINEASGLTRKLVWDDEQTAAERVRSIATQFDNCEISYTFDIDGLYVTKKYINIYRSRGNDNGVQLRLNKEIDRIVTKESIANIATALSVTGGTPDDSDTPITLSGYTYDDGDFYVHGHLLKCRSALAKWSRYIWADEPDKVSTEGQIVRTYSYDTTSQSELLQHALTELKKVSEIERNYEIDVTNLPDDARIGDRVNVIDSAGSLFVSARILKFETSDTRQENKVTLGEYLIKGNGISQQLSAMAEEFAKTAATSERAKALANAAKETAETANTTVEEMAADVQNAALKADNAEATANTANETAQAAQTAANDAQTTANSAKTIANGIEIGGRNLIPNSAPSVSFERIESQGTEVGYKCDSLTEYVASGEIVTAQAMIRGTANINFYFICTGGNLPHRVIDKEDMSADEFTKCTYTFTVPADSTLTGFYIVTAYGNTEVGDNFEIRENSLKLERGNKATDWTPAPEDVTEKIVTTVDTSETQTIETCEEIIMNALADYTGTAEFDTFKEYTETQLKQTSDDLKIQISKTIEQIESVNGTLQSQLNTITKYFTFDVNGLTIGQVDNPYKVIIDNDRYSMTVNGSDVMWIADGKVHTPDIEVTRSFNLFGYNIDVDNNGNVNCEYVGG